jgi:hypothetical protein
MSKDNPEVRIIYTLSNIALLASVGIAAVFVKNIAEDQDEIQSDSEVASISVNTLAITLSLVGLVTSCVALKEETALYINAMALANKNSAKPPGYCSTKKMTPLFAAACYLALVSAAALALGIEGLAGLTTDLSKKQNSSGFLETIVIALFSFGARNWEIGLSIHAHEPTSTIPLALIASLDLPLLSDTENSLKSAKKQYKKTLLHGSAVLSLLLTASLIAFYYPRAAANTNTADDHDDNLPIPYDCPNRSLTNQYDSSSVSISYLETKITGGIFHTPFINPIDINQTWVASLDSEATFMVISSKVMMDEIKINKATILCDIDSACELQLEDPDFSSVVLIATGNCSQAIVYNFSSTQDSEAEKSNKLLRKATPKKPLTSTYASWFKDAAEALKLQATKQPLRMA